jgi:Zn-dependent peptidase ImmA (M78 family)
MRRMDEHPTIEAIQRRAEDVLLEHEIPGPPIDVFAIAERMGLEVVRTLGLDPSVAGLLFRGPARSVIVVNARRIRESQRFACAHEIDHYLRGTGGVRLCADHADIRLDDPLDELVADRFAAELLMPSQWLWHYLRDWGCNRWQLRELFEVSDTAMTRRLRELGWMRWAA